MPNMFIIQSKVPNMFIYSRRCPTCLYTVEGAQHVYIQSKVPNMFIYSRKFPTCLHTVEGAQHVYIQSKVPNMFTCSQTTVNILAENANLFLTPFNEMLISSLFFENRVDSFCYAIKR